MHLASAVHTPTVGLFNVSDATIYGPYSNKSVAINIVDNADECLDRLNAIINEKIAMPAE
jgi:ADP-heptose:LPS heptosyltransferase